MAKPLRLLSSCVNHYKALILYRSVRNFSNAVNFDNKISSNTNYIKPNGSLIMNVQDLMHKVRNFSTPNSKGTTLLEQELEIIEAAINNLKSHLEIKEKKAKAILKKYPEFKTITARQLSSTLGYLAIKKISIDRIAKNPWLLLIDSKSLDEKVKQAMAILKVDYAVALTFVKFRKDKLEEINHVWKTDTEMIPQIGNGKSKSRLDFIAHHIECSKENVADMMAKLPMLATMSFKRLETILMMLIDGNVCKEAIEIDPKVFENNVDKLKERLNISRDQGLTLIKPWILRSSELIFEKHVTRRGNEKKLLIGHKDVGSFLQHKLGCDRMRAKEIQLRVPSTKKASAIKLNEMIEFLYSKGFTASHILETPRVLGHSVETISQRIDELNSFGYLPDSLNILCRTCKDYSSFIRRLSSASHMPLRRVSTNNK